MDAIALADLPPEILIEILSFLDGKTLILCSSVCHLWKCTIGTSPELEYAIELWAEGMVPTSSGSLTTAEKLEALHDHRRSWQNINWKSSAVVEIEAMDTCRAYELAGGVFAQQEAGANFHQWLPYTSKQVNIHDVMRIAPQDFQDFAMDPSQDLLAMLYQRPDELAHLEFRSMSLLEPHLLATLPVFSFDLEYDPYMLLSIHLAYDVIAVFFAEPARLIIFNWKMGVLIMNLIDPFSTDSVSDFHFLSPRSYILTGRDSSGQIDTYTFKGDCMNFPLHVGALQLPALRSGSTVGTIVVCSGPFLAGAIPGKLFSKSDECRIYLVLIGYDDPDRNTTWYRVFVHSRVLQKYARDDGRIGSALIVPWEDWGPEHSRIFPGKNYTWPRQVHGERAALPVGDRVHILDFSISAARSCCNAEGDEPSGFITKFISASSTFCAEDSPFKDTVTTSLPYRQSERLVEGMDENLSLFLIDQDLLVAMNENENQTTVYMF
ncbi:hypothetical protein C8R44DRAFT_808586 [Mycena epipterygia]|nr:hypothetical protein C8R44DRAFT_808586 [Mycena epipterygia]